MQWFRAEWRQKPCCTSARVFFSVPISALLCKRLTSFSTYVRCWVVIVKGRIRGQNVKRQCRGASLMPFPSMESGSELREQRFQAAQRATLRFSYGKWFSNSSFLPSLKAITSSCQLSFVLCDWKNRWDKALKHEVWSHQILSNGTAWGIGGEYKLDSCWLSW